MTSASRYYGGDRRVAGIEAEVPFSLFGVDADDEGGSLNHHLHRHFRGREKPVGMTRSRPY
ncbi:MAG: hypothetical protein KGR69_09250, partial [Verrucomicrobia bacterium]|nr:hypothetical protein [Verrucomicrobiota bacterium]